MNRRLSAFLSARLLDRKNGHRQAVLEAFREKGGLERFEPDDIRSRQAGSLAELLTKARAGVPWIREALPADGGPIRPESALDLLRQLPVMRRRDIQNHPEVFVNREAEGVVKDATGGSTGTPMEFRVDRSTQIARESSLMWADSLAGWNPGDRMAMLWGSDRDVRLSTQNARLWARWRLENRRWYNAFDMDEEKTEDYHRSLSAFQPDYLVAYAGSVHALAVFLRERNLVPGYPSRAVISSAEVMTGTMRAEVESVFGRPVFDRYGNREFGAIAAECPRRRGLHLNPCDMIVEIDSPSPCTEPGPLVITYLRNQAMPFIRYDTGDLGLWTPDEDCPCGRRTPRLLQVIGRRSDVIRAANGAWIHGEFFTHLFYGVTGVRQFQFVQETPDTYSLLIAGDRNVAALHEPDWRRRVLDKVGPDAHLDICYVDEIPPLVSGKHRFTFSRLTS